MYLLYTPSKYTGDNLLNYKSLHYYVNFVSGWVREVMVKVFNKRRVVLGKVRQMQSIISIPLCKGVLQVNHSQRMSEKS